MKRYIDYAIIITLLLCVSFAFNPQLIDFRTLQPLNAESQQTPYRLQVVLVPLDSRPPCTQFVEQIAKIAKINIIIPPAELLDNYRTPANKQALRQWLHQACATADAAIISTDMLIHGGLLASRLSLGTPTDRTEVIDLFMTIHRDYPAVKLHAFSIIPRLLLADQKGSTRFQSKMLKYSILKDQVFNFENPLDIDKLKQTESEVPQELVQRYHDLYQQNISLNFQLIDLVEQNILTTVVLGQDDGQPFGLPNMVKQTIQQYLSQKLLQDRVFVTRGTDEVALTLLGHINNQSANYTPNVYIAYSNEETKDIIMPYMPHTILTTIEEKLQIINARRVDNPESADFILYIHAGIESYKGATLRESAARVHSLLEQGYKVALVDLSEHFSQDETLLPLLMKNKAGIEKLIAYAGWNTTSNSIGTALTQAAVFTHSTALAPKDNESQFSVYIHNWEFLVSRMLDDWYYQKNVQPAINKSLKKRKIDPYNLSSHYQRTDREIRKLLFNKSIQLKNHLRYQPISIPSNNSALMISDLSLNTRLPWDRTFEIMLTPTIHVSQIPSNNK